MNILNKRVYQDGGKKSSKKLSKIQSKKLSKTQSKKLSKIQSKKLSKTQSKTKSKKCSKGQILREGYMTKTGKKVNSGCIKA